MAAVGLELAERRRDAEPAAEHNGRDGLARDMRDLHDLVVQRLFGTGMALQSAIRLVDERPELAIARVHRAVDALDTTIREAPSNIRPARAGQPDRRRGHCLGGGLVLQVRRRRRHPLEGRGSGLAMSRRYPSAAFVP